MKRICLLIALVLIGYTGHSQFINTGVRGGVIWQQLNYGNNLETQDEWNLGYNVGAMLRLRMLFISVQTDVTWGQVKTSMTNTSTMSTSSLTLNKVDLPVWVNFHLFKFIRVGIGAYYGWQWSKYGTDDAYWNDLENNANSGNWGGALVAGIQLGRFMIDCDYRVGFSKYKTNSGTSYYSTYPQLFTASVAFKLRKDPEE